MGYYVESEGSASETACAKGKTTPSTGSTLASDCIAERLTVEKSGISPDSGPVTGGTLVTIKGTGFTASAKVEVGQGQGPGPTAIMATNVHVISSTELTAETDGGAKPGTLNMYVITPAGQAFRVFTYERPTITAVSPSSGPLAGGEPITITGTGFLPGATVKIGTSAATVTTVTPTEIHGHNRSGDQDGHVQRDRHQHRRYNPSEPHAKYTYTS